MSFHIEPEHEEYFRNHFRIAQEQPIPVAIVREYWRTKRLADASAIFFDQRDLMWIALRSGHPLPNDDYNFLRVIDEQNVEYGAPVLVNFRNRPHKGVFHGVSGSNEILVTLDKQADVREFSPLDVRLQETEQQAT